MPSPPGAHSADMTAIQVHGLTKRFGDVVAVDDLSFDVQPGRVTGFLGPNGAGKTTTLRMLLGLVRPDRGHGHRRRRAICRAGRSGPPRRCRARIDQLLPRPPGPRPPPSALRRPPACRSSRVDEVLDQVGLTDVGGRRVKGFSLGMRQRLGLAAALLGQPDVLILDEPANGLDPEGVHWLRRFLRSYADQGRTVLVSSHLLAEVAQTVDDVVIIARGRLVTQSSLTDLADQARPGVWVRTPQPESLRDTLAARGTAAEVKTADTLVAWATTTDAVGLSAAGAGLVIYEMTPQHFDLEEFFLELTTTTGALR